MTPTLYERIDFKSDFGSRVRRVNSKVDNKTKNKFVLEKKSSLQK